MKMSELIKEARELANMIRNETISVAKANAEVKSRRETTRMLQLQFNIAKEQGRIKNGSTVLPDVEIED